MLPATASHTEGLQHENHAAAAAAAAEKFKQRPIKISEQFRTAAALTMTKKPPPRLILLDHHVEEEVIKTRLSHY